MVVDLLSGSICFVNAWMLSNSVCQLGGLLGTILASFLLSKLSWQWTFIVPANLVLFVAGLEFFLLVNSPDQVAEKNSLNDDLDDVEQKDLLYKEHPLEPTLSFFQVLLLPGLLNFGAAYFAIKLIRYSLLFWLPYYLSMSLNYSESTAGYMSTFFELGGILGVIIAGKISDRFSGRRVLLAAPMLLLTGVALVLYIFVGTLGAVANGLCMAIIGFFLYAPDSLLSGAAAQDVAGHNAAGLLFNDFCIH